MREILLVARREYLAYVRAWGFWLQIISLPIFMSLGGIVGGLAAKSDPVRVFAVVDPTQKIIPAIDAALTADIRDQTRRSLRAAIEAGNLAGDVKDRVLDAFDQASSAEQGLASAKAMLAGLLPDIAISKLAVAKAPFIRVEAPARDVAGLSPFLRNERLLEGPEGQQKLFAALIIPEDAAQPVQYWSTNLTNNRLRGFLSDALQRQTRDAQLLGFGVTPQAIEQINKIRTRMDAFDPSKQSAETGQDRAGAGQKVTLRDRLPFVIGMVLTYLLWSLLLGVVNTLLMGMMEERSNKIIDTLLTSTTPSQVLAGKLVGVSAVSATMLFSWVIFATFFGLYFASSGASPIIAQITQLVLSPSLLAIFAVSFVCGYLMYGAVFLAIGSLCESLQEAQSLMTPILLFMMAPLLVMVFALNNPDLAWIKIMSWIPFFTPFLILVRAPTGLPPVEIAGMVVLMIVTAIIMLWLGGKVFSAGAQRNLSASDLNRWMKRAPKPAGNEA